MRRSVPPDLRQTPRRPADRARGGVAADLPGPSRGPGRVPAPGSPVRASRPGRPPPRTGLRRRRRPGPRGRPARPSRAGRRSAPAAPRRRSPRPRRPAGPAAAVALAAGLQPLGVLVQRGEQVVGALAAGGDGATIGGRQAPGSECCPPSACMARRSRTVWSAPSRSALLTTNTSATSRMPALAAWMPSPMPGREQDQRGVRGGGDLDLGLADADGLHQHHVAAGRVEHPDGLRGRPGQPAEVAAGGHRADEDAGVGGVVPHPHPVAEQGAAGERRGRVHRQHADPDARLRSAVTSTEVEVDLPTPGEPVKPMTRARPACGASAAATSRSRGKRPRPARSAAPRNAGRPPGPRHQRGHVHRPPRTRPRTCAARRGRPEGRGGADGAGAGRTTAGRYRPRADVGRGPRSGARLAGVATGRPGDGHGCWDRSTARRPARRRRTARPRRPRRRGGAAPGPGAGRSGRRSSRSGGRARSRRR